MEWTIGGVIGGAIVGAVIGVLSEPILSALAGSIRPVAKESCERWVDRGRLRF